MKYFSKFVIHKVFSNFSSSLFTRSSNTVIVVSPLIYRFRRFLLNLKVIADIFIELSATKIELIFSSYTAVRIASDHSREIKKFYSLTSPLSIQIRAYHGNTLGGV
jgi:hypothetical protein